MILAALLLFATESNLKVLHDVPKSQLIPTMAFIANSLGVTCSHCHGKEFASDEKPMKEVARRMIILQRAINDQHYAGKLVVTCNTCHQGHAVPPATPDIAHAGWNPRPATDVARISGEQAIERLPQTPQGVTRRVIRGMVERYNGRDEPKSEPFTLTLDNSVQYTTELSHPREATRAFALYVIERLTPDRVAGEQWTIMPGVVKRYRETPTPLGNLPEEVTLTDFRETSSGRLPFRAQWSRADYRVTYTVSEITSE